MQILSDFDIFSIVGSNKPLQLVDARVSIKDDGLLVLRFEGILGSPVVSGICVRRAPPRESGISMLLNTTIKVENLNEKVMNL